jgi:hypothetical protein
LQSFDYFILQAFGSSFSYLCHFSIVFLNSAQFKDRMSSVIRFLTVLQSSECSIFDLYPQFVSFLVVSS